MPQQRSHREFLEILSSKRSDVVITGKYVKALERTGFRFLECGHECHMRPSHVLIGRGCPVCGKLRKGASQRLSLDVFRERLHNVSPYLEILSGAVYSNNRTPVPVRCRACGHEYRINLHDLQHCRGCPNCHKAGTSFFEKFIYYAFVHIFGESGVLSRDRRAIGAELDIYIPEINAAIEPGAWFWHKDQIKNDIRKQSLCRAGGIRLITVYDHFTGKVPPTEDCVVSRYDLSRDLNAGRLVDVTKTVIGKLGLSGDFDADSWKEIRQKARAASGRITTDEFKTRLSGLNNSIEVTGYFNGTNNRTDLRCKVCGYRWKATPSSLYAGSGCPRCAGTLKLTDAEFKERLKQANPDIMALEKYVNSDTKIMMQCRICGYQWHARPYHLTARKMRTGCPQCAGRARWTHEHFVKKVEERHSGIEIIGKLKSLSTPVLVRCGRCGKSWNAYPKNLLKGSGCKSCNSKAAADRRTH